MDLASPHAWTLWILTAIAAYLGAYAAEKGKRRAAREDSAQIRDELARNTQAVKEIEAKVSSDLWDRQWRLNQKRDVYSRLIEGLGELQFTIGAHTALTKAKDAADADVVFELHDRTKALLLELERSRAVARIFLSSEAVKAIDEFEEVLKGRNAADSLQFFSRATEQLISAAKDELQF
jgi:hypothetical protein